MNAIKRGNRRQARKSLALLARPVHAAIHGRQAPKNSALLAETVHAAIHGRQGQAIVVVLMICLVLGILFGAVMQFQRGHIHLLSKTAKDYLALNVAEAGLQCVLAEMKADYQFVTHGNAYIPGQTGPANHRHFLVGEAEGIELDHKSSGTYSGRIVMKKTKVVGEFKVRVTLIKAQNNPDSQTVDESHRYFQVEAIGKVDDSFRKVTGVIEKFLPYAYQFYDGQVLDTGGNGPYRVVPGIVRRGRVYGHEMIKLSKRGVFDNGCDFLDMEKISTPGHIEAGHSTHLTFRNGKEGRLKPENDSSHPEAFDTNAESAGGKDISRFVLDGAHGGKPEKFPPLNPKYYKEAYRPKAKILSPGCGFSGFSESKWKNPGKPNEVVYDLNFGWDYKKDDEKELLYSTVPLRIWGCPRWKALTIFSEKDVYIAGDFNQNPETPQNYDIGFRDYTQTMENGTDKNGVVVMSMGRIWFDYSQPCLFLRNEMRTVIDNDLATCLGGKDLNPLLLAAIVFPYRSGAGSMDSRLPMTGLNFKSIAALFSLPKEPPQVIPVTLAGLLLHPALKDLNKYLEPSENPEEYKVRFCIKSWLKRKEIVEKVGAACYLTGLLTKGERDHVINSMIDQAYKEIQEEPPNKCLGPWNIADRIFKQAVTHPKTRFQIPEMTVNAILIDSAELNGRWDPSDGPTKVLNEIGNIENAQTKSLPFITDNSRFILRHLGGRINLRTRSVDPFLDGRLRKDNVVVRRNIWDRKFLSGENDYIPAYPMAGFGLAQWKDDASDSSEFNSL